MAPRLRTVVSVVLAVAAVGYMVIALRGAPAALHGAGWSLRPWLFAAGVLLNVGLLSIGALLWWCVLERVAPGSIAPRPLWRISGISSLARYVPGRIWHVTSLGAMLGEAGVTMGAMFTSLVLHMWLCLLSAAIVASALVVMAPWPLTVRLAVVGAVLVGAMAGVHPAPLRLASGLIARVTRRSLVRWTAGWVAGLALLAAYTVVTILVGVSSCVVLASTTGIVLSEAPRVIAGSSAAFIAGYLSLVPAGLGVREAILTLVLSGTASTGAAAASAVVLRIAAVLADALLALLAVLVRDGSRRSR